MAGYDSIIAAASRRFNVPESHIRAVMGVESGGRPNAVSERGAGGLMQLMPATYEELRGKHGFGPDRFDPVNNIMAGTAYLRENNDRFGGDWDKTFAAYNGGPSRVARGGPLPRETQAYVPKVNAMIPTLIRPRPGQTVGQGVPQAREADLRNLLDFEMPPAVNHMDGLGSLANTGQTPQQEPRPGERIGSRIDELIGQLSQPYDRGPQMTPGQYQIAGMTGAATQLAGVHNRKVGFGELLGALGGGLVKGTEAGAEAQRQQRAAEFGELGNLTKLQQHQRGEATSARQIQAANAYADQIEKINPGLAAAVRNNPSLMDEIAKEQAKQQFNTTDPTSQHKNAVAMGYQPGTQQYIDYVRAASMPAGATTVNMGGVEKEQDKAYGTDLVKEYTGVREQGAAAENSLRQIEIARKIPVVTGATAPLFAKVGAVAESLGFDRKVLETFGLNQASPAEAFTGVMNNLVLSKMMEQKGPQTDRDAERIQSTVAQLGNTPEAADFLLRTAQALAQRDIDRHRFYDQYRATHKTFEGASAAWRSQVGNQPLVGYNPNTKLPVFYGEFMSGFKKANPQATDDDARQYWNTKYGADAPPPDTAGHAASAGKAVKTLAEFTRQYFDANPNATLDQIRQAWEAATNGR